MEPRVMSHDARRRQLRHEALQAISDRSSGSQSRTFKSAGTYRYACTLDPGMSGRITVR